MRSGGQTSFAPRVHMSDDDRRRLTPEALETILAIEAILLKWYTTALMREMGPCGEHIYLPVYIMALLRRGTAVAEMANHLEQLCPIADDQPTTPNHKECAEELVHWWEDNWKGMASGGPTTRCT